MMYTDEDVGSMVEIKSEDKEDSQSSDAVNFNVEQRIPHFYKCIRE